MSFGGMLHSTYEFNKDNLDDYWMFAYENRNLPVDKGQSYLNQTYERTLNKTITERGYSKDRTDFNLIH